MTKRKLSSILLTLVVLLIVSFLQKTNPELFNDEKRSITPTPVASSRQNDVVLGSQSAMLDTQKVKVKKVIDGDTIEIEGGQKIRYIGIDTPETKHPTKGIQCFGKEASAKNKELVEGKEIVIQKDVSETDRYVRLLRFVYLATGSGEMLFINDYLIRQGYALASTYPPDVKLADQFALAQKEARENNRGLWGSCP